MAMLRWGVVAVFVVTASSLGEREPPTDGYHHVTCGSTIKLQYAGIAGGEFRLQSHEVAYGSGSGQQSVTLKRGADDNNGFWTVFGGIGTNWACKRGGVIKNGRIVRLQHTTTKKWLHSHAEFRSPLSNNQEVSAFGSLHESNSADNWQVVLDEKDGLWARERTVRLKHIDTGNYLMATGQHQFGHPIEGQREVAAGRKDSSPQQQWTAMEGLYVKEKKPKKYTMDDLHVKQK